MLRIRRLGQLGFAVVMSMSAIMSILAVSPHAAIRPSETAIVNGIAPRTSPTPRKVKSVAVGDVNGDGADVINRSAGKPKVKSNNTSNAARKNGNLRTSRTETVNNNESLRVDRGATTRNLKVDQTGSNLSASGAQDDSGTENANRHAKRASAARPKTSNSSGAVTTTSNGIPNYIGTPGDGQGVKRRQYKKHPKVGH